MSTAEFQNLEARIAAIEENLGITGSKSLQEVLAEEAGAVAHDRYKRHEISSLDELREKLRYTVVFFCDSIESTATQNAIKHFEFNLKTRGGTDRGSGLTRQELDTWGFWENDHPLFEIKDEELKKWTEGNQLPIARLPDKDESSDATTLWVCESSEDDSMEQWVSPYVNRMRRH